MRGAVLIIGSLKWDQDERRRSWRKARLSMDSEIQVNVPLMYGRKSQSRGNTFTMVFGGSSGIGLLIPFEAELSDGNTLMNEAEALWAAEAANAEGRISANWGSVGAIFKNCDSTAVMSTEWTTRFAQRVSNPPEPVNALGILDIAWPTNMDGHPVSFDVIISTATKREDKPPTPIEVATAWAAQDKGLEEYFLENLAHGIRTAEDAEIWKHLRHAAPTWLNNGNHAAYDAEFGYSENRQCSTHGAN